MEREEGDRKREGGCEEQIQISLLFTDGQPK